MTGASSTIFSFEDAQSRASRWFPLRGITGLRPSGTRRFPGRGAPLIEAGLKSLVVRNRNMAVAALSARSREQWSSRLEKSLDRAAECEPDDGVRDRMQKG